MECTVVHTPRGNSSGELTQEGQADTSWLVKDRNDAFFNVDLIN
jgi:hypothetical protein